MQLVEAGVGIGEISLNEFLSGSLSCLARSGKIFLTIISLSIHEKSIVSNATESLLLMLCAWLQAAVEYVHLLFQFGTGF